jgi:enoyl-[acyl-carrier-protein] reductase (NADH)
MLCRSSRLAQVANAAAFFASDLAGATTGTVFNLSSGTVVN